MIPRYKNDEELCASLCYGMWLRYKNAKEYWNGETEQSQQKEDKIITNDEKRLYTTNNLRTCTGIAKQNANGKWELWSVTENMETGSIEYQERKFPEDAFDKVEPSDSDASRPALWKVCKDGIWSLIQVKFKKDGNPLSADSWEWTIVKGVKNIKE
jgi:hypothetical protein